MTMISECPMHTFYTASPNFAVKRCAHRGSRYVIETMHADGRYLAVDYVDQPGDGSIVIEPANYRDWDYADPDGAWDHFVARMKSDDPPDPSRSPSGYMTPAR